MSWTVTDAYIYIYAWLCLNELKPKSCEISFAHNLYSYPVVLKLCIEFDSDRAYSVQNFKTIVPLKQMLKQMLWANKILGDMSLRWVSDRYPVWYCTKPLMLNSFLGNNKMCLIFLPFLQFPHRDGQVSEVRNLSSSWKTRFVYPAWSMSWLRMPWWCKEPGH